MGQLTAREHGIVTGLNQSFSNRPAVSNGWWLSNLVHKFKLNMSLHQMSNHVFANVDFNLSFIPVSLSLRSWFTMVSTHSQSTMELKWWFVYTWFVLSVAWWIEQTLLWKISLDDARTSKFQDWDNHHHPPESEISWWKKIMISAERWWCPVTHSPHPITSWPLSLTGSFASDELAQLRSSGCTRRALHARLGWINEVTLEMVTKVKADSIY